MLLHSFACPDCGRILKVTAGLEEGTRVKCPRCGASFAATADEQTDDLSLEEGPLPRKAKTRSSGRRRPAEDDYDDEDEPRHKRKKRIEKEVDPAVVIVKAIVVLAAVGAIAWAGYHIYKNRLAHDAVDENGEPKTRPVAEQPRPFVQQPQQFVQQPKQVPNREIPNPKRHVGEGRVYNQTPGFSIVPPRGWTAGKTDGKGPIMAFVSPIRNDNYTPNFYVLPFASNDTIEQAAAKSKKGSAAMRSYVFGDDGMVTIDGTKAYFHHFTADLKDTGDNEPLKLKFLHYIVLSKDGNGLFLLTFIALPADFDKLRKFVDESANTIQVD